MGAEPPVVDEGAAVPVEAEPEVVPVPVAVPVAVPEATPVSHQSIHLFIYMSKLTVSTSLGPAGLLTEHDDPVDVLTRAGLRGAVSQAVSEVFLGAETVAVVGRRAAKLDGLAQHAADTGSLSSSAY